MIGKGQRKTIWLRVFGAAMILSSALLVWFGGRQVSLDLFGGAILSVPFEYLLLVFGLLLLILPLAFVYVLAIALPQKYEERLTNFADGVDPETEMLRENPNAQNITTILTRHISSTRKKLYVSLFVLFLFAFVALPLLVRNAISVSERTRASQRLVILVQENRIDFASGDHFREHLHDAEGGVMASDSPTSKIYEVLKIIYDPSIRNGPAFDKAISFVYESRIKSYVTETGLLRMESFNLKKSSSDSNLAPATYLTLLSTVCNLVGDNGKHLDPYIQGHQLMKLALTQVSQNDSVPATHNMAGINYAGLLKAYPELKEKFSKPQNAEKIQAALGINALPSELSLLRQAKAEYIAAEQQSPSNLAKARSLNNQVDVLLTFIYSIHIKKKLDPDIIRDETDRRFLEDELAIRMPGNSVDHQRLVQVLDAFNNSLTEALKLSQEPDIFFTHAQLLSLGGQLGEQYGLINTYWAASDVVAETALTNLRTARSMQMPKRFFEQSEAEQLYLSWLWKRPNLVQQLEQIGRQ